MEGELEDDYELGECVGSGNTGKVYKAVDRRTKELVAVKRVRKMRLLWGAFTRRNFNLRNEVDVMRNLEHPNIVRLLRVYDTKSELCMVMEYAHGGMLLDRVRQLGGYPEDKAQEVVATLISTVQYLHNKHTVHRDLKPDNVMLMEKDSLTRIKLADFGFSKAGKSTLRSFVGTPGYIAPEMLGGRSRGYGKEVDVWAIGVATYEILTGRHPFQGRTINEVYLNISTCHLSFRGARWKEVSPEAADFIECLLNVDPHERPTLNEARHHPWLAPVFEAHPDLLVPFTNALGPSLHFSFVPTNPAGREASASASATSGSGSSSGSALSNNGSMRVRIVVPITPVREKSRWWSLRKESKGGKARSTPHHDDLPTPSAPSSRRPTARARLISFANPVRSLSLATGGY